MQKTIEAFAQAVGGFPDIDIDPAKMKIQRLPSPIDQAAGLSFRANE